MNRSGIVFWVLPLVFLGVFFFLPLGSIFTVMFSKTGVVTLNDTWQPLKFTVFQAVISTLLTLALGLPAAFVFARFEFPLKKLAGTLTLLPFILPTVVVAAGFNALLGPRGWINVFLGQLLNLDAPSVNFLNTFTAILVAHVFYNIAIVIRVVGSAWSQLDPRLDQSSQVLGASPLRTLREVTLPLLKPSILVAGLLVFLFDFTSFGVILLLGGVKFATLEVAIYAQALSFLNLPMAGLLSLVQLVCTVAITFVYTRVSRGKTVPLFPRLKGEGTRKPQTAAQRLFITVTLLFLFTLQVLPLTALVARSFTQLEADRGQRGEVQTGLTFQYYRELFINRQQSIFYVPPAKAALNSLFYAAVTVVISLVMGGMLAYALVKRARLRKWLDLLVMLPLGASAVTLGLGFIITFNHPPLDPRSFPLLIPIAHSLVAIPFVVRTIQPAMASIPDQMRQSAAVLGASSWQVWREVELPVIYRAGLVAALFSFAISLGEFGATSFISRPENPTLPVAIYRYLSQPGALNYGQAMAMASILVLVCGVSIWVLERIRVPGVNEG